MAQTRVAVHGALGRMGRTVMDAVAADPDLELVGGADRDADGSQAELANGVRVPVSAALEETLERTNPQVLVDFTNASAAMEAIRSATRRGVAVVSGSTGLSGSDLEEAEQLALSREVGVISAPNFALGAVLLMHLARIASKYFDYADVLESHHEAKVDAPSGTALAIARAMVEGHGGAFRHNVTEKETLAGTRGGDFEGINVHSARMPGRVASHSVVFGAAGQTLSLVHDSINRESFMPGVILATKRVIETRGLTVGLDKVLGLSG